MGKVIRIQDRAPDAALERLQRLTGLDFESWPESLLRESVQGGPPSEVDAKCSAPGGEYVAAPAANAKR
ncbi:hypothetical protein K8B33_15435 [Alcanivorax sp. JB21]|uniref:hypothetical protein n=1 Tax=Alcanivorax limicola TaxID=2874102 RepID=UPI001CBEEC43|nr:hypothetical protein [Alcanivorax limicola]MBZ2190502.1 hypothetical protein [Alcanivorax limicola]